MNIFEQSTGKFYDGDSELLAIGYSGGDVGNAPDAVNNPAFQSKPNIGPLPVGFYTIGPPQDTVTHGPYVLPLSPSPANQMFGRGGFLIHGDSVVAPGKRAASEGCIILPRSVRQQIWESNDHELQVVSGLTIAVN